MHEVLSFRLEFSVFEEFGRKSVDFVKISCVLGVMLHKKESKVSVVVN